MAEAKGAGWMCHPLLPAQLRDRLRAIECPADIIDAIGGWTTEASASAINGWMDHKIVTISPCCHALFAEGTWMLNNAANDQGQSF